MKKLPKHRSEAEERDFWAKEDSSEFIDWKAASRVTFSKLKPSLRTISPAFAGDDDRRAKAAGQ